MNHLIKAGVVVILTACGGEVFTSQQEIDSVVSTGGSITTTATSGASATTAGAGAATTENNPNVSGGSSAIQSTVVGGETSSAGSIGTTGGTSFATGGASFSTGGHVSIITGGSASTGGRISTTSAGATTGGISYVIDVPTGGASQLVTGGASAIGGSKASTGGTLATGGSHATGGATGGSKFTGGAVSTGGLPATGGMVTMGGNTGIGCPGTDGTAMAKLPLGYCIDSTEVTKGQYQTWLNTNPSTANQSSACSWNTNYTPAKAWPPDIAFLNYPVAWVNWCDAYAYCAGVGKRLCGKIGGGSNSYNDYASSTFSQWYFACTSAGIDTYTYGSSYSANACDGADYGMASTVAVGSMAGCQSSIAGYTGVYDMNGNVWEWEDSCTGTVGQSDKCRIRGGSYESAADILTCGIDNSIGRDYASSDVGFRCCS